MMTSKDEALKMVINWFEGGDFYYPEELLNACKEALEQPAQDYVFICKRCGDDLGIEYVPDEQPAQEPVAWGNPKYNYAVHHKVKSAWQGLTDDVIASIWMHEAVPMNGQDFKRVYRAIEQALKEKNT